MFLSLLMRHTAQLLRVLRNVVTKPFLLLGNKLRRATNVGRYFSRIPKVAAALPKGLKKPKARSDYVTVGKSFIAKKLLILLILLIIVLPILFYLFLWPILQPRFFTARFTAGDPVLEGYSGRVVIYYDESKRQPMFTGRLLDGNYNDRGMLYFENGFVMYSGGFAEGLYEGVGRLYAEDGRIVYEGSFVMGRYHGRGTLFDRTGALLYEGDFDRGVYNGQGTLYFPAGGILYDGAFLADMYHGLGTLYISPEIILYSGSFENGLYQGAGELYDESGNLLYTGEFENGRFSGTGNLFVNGTLRRSGEFRDGEMSGWGLLYDELGELIYEGGFSASLYDGHGTLFGGGAIIYTGGFSAGLFSGEGTLYMPDGFIYEGSMRRGAAEGIGRLMHGGALLYSGDFFSGYVQGEGTLTDRASGVRYNGRFDMGKISPGELLAAEPPAIYEAFESGMTQHLTQTRFYLFNTAFGLALSFDYADREHPARLVRLYMLPKAVLPRVGGEADDSTVWDAFPAPTPDPAALSLLEFSFESDLLAFREIRGTVSVTMWMSADGRPALYVIEAADASALPVPNENGSEDGDSPAFAERKYYLEFGLEEIAPAA